MDALKSKSIGPALTLMIVAPLLTEVLPGATRFSSMFVFPIEVCVWGGGALLIRYAVRRWKLGWRSMLLLALCLAIAEEFLIQQTSVAPMVIRLKGITYARALGINYVYLLWALVYEMVFVVFFPVYLVELIFPARKEGLWINKAGVVLVSFFFVIGSFLAWYSWTQIARPKVFHVPAYHSPIMMTVLAVVVISILGFSAFSMHEAKTNILKPPPVLFLGAAGWLWAVLWYALVLLGFGIAPYFPPAAAIAGGFVIVAIILIFVPRWTHHPDWKEPQIYALTFGAVLGAMMIGFIGFIDAVGPDLYFKIGVNIIAVILLVWLGKKVNTRITASV